MSVGQNSMADASSREVVLLQFPIVRLDQISRHFSKITEAKRCFIPRTPLRALPTSVARGTIIAVSTILLETERRRKYAYSHTKHIFGAVFCVNRNDMYCSFKYEFNHAKIAIVTLSRVATVTILVPRCEQYQI